MKPIEEYIKKITNHIDPEYDWLDECLLNQLNIYHNFNLITITESMILESKGSFPSQSDIVNKILKEIDITKPTNIIDIDNNVVDKIYLHFKHNKYVVDNERYDDYNIVRCDNDKERYRFAEININDCENKNDLEELLYHETQHLWDDYQLMIHKNISLSDKVKKSLDRKFSDSHINDT